MSCTMLVFVAGHWRSALRGLFLWGVAQLSRVMLQNWGSHRYACAKLSTKGGMAPLWGSADIWSDWPVICVWGCVCVLWFECFVV